MVHQRPISPWAIANEHACSFRRRADRRRLKFDNLQTQGVLANLLVGGLLIGFNSGGSVPFQSSTFYRETMESSQVFLDLPAHAQRRLLRADHAHYERIENAFTAFGANVMLAAPDSDDKELGLSLYKLKLWFIKFSLWNPDDAISYLKWLSKSCQTIALGKGPIEGLSSFPGYNAKTGIVLDTPFKGCLEFINKLFIERSVDPNRGRRQLMLEEYRALAQLAGISRALPYPSDRQIARSVEETLDLIYSEAPKPSDTERKLYSEGLKRQLKICGKPEVGRSHSSLTTSACLEHPRSEGGRGLNSMSEIKLFARLSFEPEHRQFVELVDCFNETVIYAEALIWAEQTGFMVNDRGLTWGDIAYVRPEKLSEHIQYLTDWKFEVPKQIGHIAALIASRDMLQFGAYNREPVMAPGSVPLFKGGHDPVEFLPSVRSIPVRAGLSIESGMKTRLITSAPAAITTVTQLIRHNVSGWLSNDPMLKIGFKEADKLWEVLKAYEKLKPATRSGDSYMLSTDLKEATYHFPHWVLDSNVDFLRVIFWDHPSMRCFWRILKIHSRTLDLTDLVRKGYASYLDAELGPTTRGAFMGDSLSFMHLTLALASATWQASYVAYTGRSRSVFAGGGPDYISRPLGQIVGDDNLVLAAPLVYCQTFREALEGISLRISKIDSEDPYFGVFCEQGFCIPADGNSAELANYDKVSKKGDLFFLDIIKGSALAVMAKVKSDGADPMLGHLRMAAKQMRWHPLPRIKRLLPPLLWAIYAPKSYGLGDVKPFFPVSVGGLNVPLGPVADLIEDNNLRENYTRYIEAVCQLPLEQFFQYWSGWHSISRGAEKGVPWDPNSIELASLISKIKLIKGEDYKLQIPDYITRKGWQAEQNYANEQLGIIPLLQLAEELSRLAAYREFWDGRLAKPSYITLNLKGMRKRFRTVWSRIRSEVKPVLEITSKSELELTKLVDNRTWALYVCKDDPAIIELYGGMSSLICTWHDRSDFLRGHSSLPITGSGDQTFL